ncbi:MAG: cupin domain-containing protein [Burkholderiaceae bacterium]
MKSRKPFDPASSVAAVDAPDPLRDPASAARFMQMCWQRRPALLRGTDVCRAPGLVEALAPAALRALAADPAVESRLVSRRGRRYRLEQGPIVLGRQPVANARQWTLLVQGVDLHSEVVARLRERFRFVADVRLDDIMASLAGDGGGVGPHVDSYDVFLIQMHGKRRWRIAPPGPPHWQSGQPLRVLAEFEAREEMLLEPGDMLYLPPGWGHDGIAVGPDCVTASVGFRAPSAHELLGSFLQDQVDQLLEQTPEPDDPEGQPLPDRLNAAEMRHWQDRPAALSPGLIRTLTETLARWRPEREAMVDFIGRMLTEPKPGTAFALPTPAKIDSLAERAAIEGIVLDRRTRMAYLEDTLFINGDSFVCAGRTSALLAELADRRQLPRPQLRELLQDPDVSEVLVDWLDQGWIHPGQKPTS